MGSEFARRLARDGLNLVLVTRRKDRLDRLVSELSQQFGTKARALVADLSRQDLIDPIHEATANIERGDWSDN